MTERPDVLGGRPTCLRCHKPEVTCICGYVPLVDNRTFVRVLQHKRERHHPIGTARFVELGLRRSSVEVCYGSPAPPKEEGWAVLYPDRRARPLTEADPKPERLVVLDGTWRHVYGMYRDNPWLQELPCYGLTPERSSNYRIRKEPSRQCVSTIEAVVQALRVLEPDCQGLDDLLGAFDTMIDRQIMHYRSALEGRPHGRNYKPATEPSSGR